MPSSQLHLVLPSRIFPSGLATIISHSFLIYPMRATYPMISSWFRQTSNISQTFRSMQYYTTCGYVPPLRCPAYRSFLHFTILTIIVDLYKQLSSSLYNILNFSPTLYFLEPNILLNISFSDTWNLWSSLKIRGCFTPIKKPHFCMFCSSPFWKLDTMI
jgi:hypothetical protein